MSRSGEPVAQPNPIRGYEDWPAAVRGGEPFVGPTVEATQLGQLLGLRRRRPAPRVVEEESRTLDGVEVRRLRWSVGYGPETSAWVLRPAGARGDLPAVLGMHCHGGVRSVGAEQLVDLGDQAHPRAATLRQAWYDGPRARQ